MIKWKLSPIVLYKENSEFENVGLIIKVFLSPEEQIMLLFLFFLKSFLHLSHLRQFRTSLLLLELAKQSSGQTQEYEIELLC